MVSNLRNIFLKKDSQQDVNPQSRLQKIVGDFWIFGIFASLLYIFILQQFKILVIILLARFGAFSILVGSQEYKELHLKGNITESILEYRKTIQDSSLIFQAKIILLSFIIGIGFLSAGLSLLMAYIDPKQASTMIADRQIVAFLICLLFAVFIFFAYKVKRKVEAEARRFKKIMGDQPQESGNKEEQDVSEENQKAFSLPAHFINRDIIYLEQKTQSFILNQNEHLITQIPNDKLKLDIQAIVSLYRVNFKLTMSAKLQNESIKFIAVLLNRIQDFRPLDVQATLLSDKSVKLRKKEKLQVTVKDSKADGVAGFYFELQPILQRKKIAELSLQVRLKAKFTQPLSLNPNQLKDDWVFDAQQRVKVISNFVDDFQIEKKTYSSLLRLK